MSDEDTVFFQKLNRITRTIEAEMGPRQKKATLQELNLVIKIVERPEEFYDIKEKVVNTIIFTTVVIEIIFVTAWFMNKCLYGFPAWLLLFKYLGVIILLLRIFANPITDKILRTKK
jgi:hypothetical protein